MSGQDMSQPPFIGQIEQTGNNTFKAPETIFKSLQAARTLYTKFRANHLKRIVLYTEIDGLIAGNPPYPVAELRAAGLNHVSNFNDLSGRAVIERAALAYWNLLHNSEYLTRFVIRGKDPELDFFAKILARHWDYAVRLHWPSFIVNVASLAWQLVKFGISPVLFADERDPRWRVIELNRFFIADQAQSDLDLLTTVMVESEFTIQYLWSVYEEFKDKAKETIPGSDLPPMYTPWNVYEIGKLLFSIGTSPIKDTVFPHDLLEMERKLYSGDISFDRMFNDTVRIVSLFQKEYDGKISHYMFHRNLDSGGTTPEGNFLFFQQGQFNTMNEAFVLFTMNPGEYTIHANRGIGHKIYSLAQAKIMMDCSVVDMGKWASTPILKSPSLNSRDVEQIRFYPGVPTNIGSSEFIQNNLGGNIEGVVSVAQYLSNLIQFNITYSGSDPSQPDPDTGSISPTQTRLQAFREFSVLKNNIMHFYATFDHLLRNMTAKMLHSKEGYPGYEIAECWKTRCLEDGVPPEVFETNDSDEWRMPKHLEVYATRAAGAGSQVAHLIGLQEIGETIAPSFGPREERAFKRDFIMATLGPEAISSYLQEGDEVDEVSGGASLAGVENAVMQAGKSPIFSKDNEHRAHFSVHAALAQEVIQGIQQQRMDVIQADSIFGVLVPHMGEHLGALEKNPFAASFVQKVKPIYDQIARYAALNRKNAAKALQKQIKDQREAQQNQQQAMSAEELKQLQVTNDEKRKDEKLAAQNQRQERAGTAKEQALFRKTEADIAIKTQKTTSDIQNETRRVAAELQNDAVQRAQENASEYLEKLNGNTPSPTDIEGA